MSFLEGTAPVRNGQHSIWYKVFQPELLHVIGCSDEELLQSDVGRPVVCIHGGPGMPHDYLVPSLLPLGLPCESSGGRRRSVVFYDQLGCGKSDKPQPESTAPPHHPNPLALHHFSNPEAEDTSDVHPPLPPLYSIGAAVADLHALITHLTRTHCCSAAAASTMSVAVQVHLLGHSWGGIIGHEYAAWLHQHPHHADAPAPVTSPAPAPAPVPVSVRIASSILISTPTSVQVLEAECAAAKQQIVVDMISTRMPAGTGTGAQGAAAIRPSSGTSNPSAVGPAFEVAMNERFLSSHFCRHISPANAAADMSDAESPTAAYITSLVDVSAPRPCRGLLGNPALRFWAVQLGDAVAAEGGQQEPATHVASPPPPLLVVTGEHDMVTPKCTRDWRRACFDRSHRSVSGEVNLTAEAKEAVDAVSPSVEYYVVPDTSHMCMVELDLLRAKAETMTSGSGPAVGRESAKEGWGADNGSDFNTLHRRVSEFIRDAEATRPVR